MLSIKSICNSNLTVKPNKSQIKKIKIKTVNHNINSTHRTNPNQTKLLQIYNQPHFHNKHKPNQNRKKKHFFTNSLLQKHPNQQKPKRPATNTTRPLCGPQCDLSLIPRRLPCEKALRSCHGERLTGIGVFPGGRTVDRSPPGSRGFLRRIVCFRARGGTGRVGRNQCFEMHLGLF